MAEYEILGEYLDALRQKIEAGEEVVIEVRERAMYGRKLVKARVDQSPDKLPNGEKLWVSNMMGDFDQPPWAIQVVEELDPDAVEITPQSDFRRVT